MMNKILKGLMTLFSALAVQVSFAQQVKLSPNVKQAFETVKADEIKADIAYLADDKLQGRMPGTEGYQMAVDYVIGRLKLLKVIPAGENGTWLQTVRLRKATTQKGATATLTNAGDVTLTVGKNISITPNAELADVNVSGQLVFAGYGVSEPKLGYDDYAGIDVKGKVVLITRGAPDAFPSSVMAHVSNATTILKTATEHGAIGVIIALADTSGRFPGIANRPAYSVMDAKGKVSVSRSFYSMQVKLFGNLDSKTFGDLMKQEGKDLKDVLSLIKSGKTQSFDLKAGINAVYHSDYKDMLSYNIIGKITGSDPKLKNQYVVHSAHLDHLGFGVPVQGDSLYNGAHDNASGVASLLGIAKVYANMKVKPKRSILVVMVTGEEMGDLGSGYFAKYPTVPKASMIADVNTDMPTIIAPLLSITALGAEHSSLSKQVDQAAKYMGITVEPDPEPKQARFTRSDQYSFVVQGIPALHVKYGNKTADGKNNLADIVAPWRAKYYHKPQDDINGVFDFDAGKKYAQLNFLIGYLIAKDVKKPVWNKDDIFSTPAKK
ncbi:M28 family peptidase [Mucilaginibacter sp. HMF5004]|uniref:M28 family peptidase n=1 Tax=Mucilaginibacter rivuli TaxID=2857527 RepID=UPI001C5D014E|nr:M28 family peptidase [Mucilaginibacter rivuli]MBW4889045.1 M28 family peptidase [Mucilaginibacter rivuli]